MATLVQRDALQAGVRPRVRGAIGELAAHHGHRRDGIVGLRREGHRRRAQDLAERRGDRWPPIGASGALGLPDVQAVAVELDVLPAQAIDLLAPQARVEGERVRNPVLELQRAEQLLGLLKRCDTSARLLVVRRQLDSADRIARDEPPGRARRPAIDRADHRNEIRDAGSREPFLAEPVDPQLPVDLGQLGRVPTAELGDQASAKRSLVALQRRRASSRRRLRPSACRWILSRRPPTTGARARRTGARDRPPRRLRLRLWPQRRASSAPPLGRALSATTRACRCAGCADDLATTARSRIAHPSPSLPDSRRDDGRRRPVSLWSGIPSRWIR